MRIKVKVTKVKVEGQGRSSWSKMQKKIILNLLTARKVKFAGVKVKGHGSRPQGQDYKVNFKVVMMSFFPGFTQMLYVDVLSMLRSL